MRRTPNICWLLANVAIVMLHGVGGYAQNPQTMGPYPPAWRLRPRRNHCNSRKIVTTVDSILICRSLFGKRLLFRTSGMTSTFKDGDSKQVYF
jgi:hypothetical protein